MSLLTSRIRMRYRRLCQSQACLHTAMTAFKMTVLAALLASVSGDAPLSTSYGVPHSDSYGPNYGGHGGHETVKRHTGAGVVDCNCSGGRGSSSYDGGSASVHPAYSGRQPTRPNYNVLMASPQQPYVYPQPAQSPSAPAVSPLPQHPAPPSQPSYTYPQPAPVVLTQPQHPVPSPQPSYTYPKPAPVVSTQLQHPAPSPPPSYTYTQPAYSAPSPPAPVASPQPQQPVVPQQPTTATYAQPIYSTPTTVQHSYQPTKPNYNAIQAPPSVHSFPAQPPPPRPVYSGGGRPMYSGGRPDYNAYPPQGYAGWGLSTKPYNFGYSVKDFHQGTDFKQQETSDGNTVKGQYRVQLPDGRLQIVTYTADWQTGFHADVQYEGEANYPAVYGTGGSYPPSSHHSSSYGAPTQTSYSAPTHTSYSTSPQTSYAAPSAAPSSSGWNQGPSYQDRVGLGGVGSQYLNIGHSAAGSSYGTPTASSYHPTRYGK